jgi:hypothetical protein
MKATAIYNQDGGSWLVPAKTPGELWDETTETWKPATYAEEYCKDCFEETGKRYWLLDEGQLKFLNLPIPEDKKPREGNAIPLHNKEGKRLGSLQGSAWVQEWCPRCGRSRYLLLGK